MNFEQYLKKPLIPKVVDPGSSDGPLTASKSLIDLPKDIKDSQEVPDTPLTSLVSDVLETAQVAGREIDESIALIVAQNQSVPVFKEYAQSLQANYFDPVQFITNPGSTPKDVVRQDTIIQLEREVYRNVTDQKAPFLRDLYNMKADARTSESVLEYYWKKAFSPESFFKDYDNSDPLARRSLFKEQQYLNQLRYQNNRIVRTPAARLSGEFLDYFANYILKQLNFASLSDLLGQLERLIKILNYIRFALTVSVIAKNEFWEQTNSNIVDAYGQLANFNLQKFLKAQAYIIVNGVKESVTEFSQGLEAPTLDLGDLTLLDAATQDLYEFKREIELVVHGYLSKVEDDLISKERMFARMEESRRLMINNARKASHTKELVELLSISIRHLQSLQVQLSGLGSDLVYQYSYFRNNIQDQLDNYTKRPYNPLPSPNI